MRYASKTQKLVAAAVLTALLAVLSPFVIPIGPIPISLGVFGVALVGAMLPPAWAMASIAAYLLMGMAGLPVFTAFRAGPGVVLGVTGGYLLGYFLLALAISLATSRGLPAPVRAACAAAGMAGCYLLGTLWYMLVSGAGFASGLMLCVVPFILPDCAKIAAAMVLAAALQRRLQRSIR